MREARGDDGIVVGFGGKKLRALQKLKRAVKKLTHQRLCNKGQAHEHWHTLRKEMDTVGVILGIVFVLISTF